MPRVVIRVDASDVIGTGHVMRCLNLAGALRERGMDVAFVSREHAGNLCKLIEQRGFPLSRLPIADSTRPLDVHPVHAAWLGTGWQEDAEQTRAVIEASGAAPDWLIVDHYALEQRWENALRGSAGRILVIDDLADRTHCADLLLDQNLVERMADRHAGLLPAGSGFLLGPDYALLQPHYAGLHTQATARKGPIKRLFVYFGGSDEHAITRRAVAAFMRSSPPGIAADVVVPNESLHAEIRREFAGDDRLNLHGNLPSLAALMAGADLAIGAGGVATWERLCLGLPALVVTVAENQRAISEELDRRGLIRYLGHHDCVDESAIADALGGLLGQDSDEAWSRRCLAIVDGRGAARVSAVLAATAATPLQARRVRQEDEARLLEWANDRITRQNAFSPQQIDAATHRAWFRARIHDAENCRFHIVETEDGEPIGTVRFERSGPDWEVHFSLAPVFRGRGLGRGLLEAALLNLRADNMAAARVFGRVKEGNLASRRIFESLAFERDAGTDADGGVIVYRRTW